MASDNLDLRDQLAGLMGWTCEDTFLNNIGEARRWKKDGVSKLSLAGGAFHPIDNTMDAASAAIRSAGLRWERGSNYWCTHKPPKYSSKQTVFDTGDETHDLLALAVEVWKVKSKELRNEK